MAERAVEIWGYLRRRIIVISTMERDVRLTFIFGATIIALAVALNIFRAYLGPSMRIAVGTIPVGAVAALVFGELVTFFLIALAILLLKQYWSYLAHLLVLATVIVFAAVNEFEILSFALVMPMAMLWVFAWLGHRQHWAQREYVLGALSTSLAVMLVFVVFVASGREVLMISALGSQGLLAMLGLCMAATDIAELLMVAVESATAKLTTLLRQGWLALALAIIGILAGILLTLTTTDGSARAVAQHLGAATGLALWLGLIYWMVVSRRKQLGSVEVHIDYRALFLIVGAYFIALQAGVAYQFFSDPASYRPAELFTYPRVFLLTTLGALLFIVLFLAVGHRSETIFVRLAYGVGVGMFIFHYYSSQGGNIVLIIAAVAMGSLLFLVFALLSRKLRANYAAACLIVADLNLAFAAYAFVANLFLRMGAHEPSEALGVGQALIILAALAWDIVSSGEAITNRHSETFPRLARVAIFIAYTVSVALLVMVSTAGQFDLPVSGAEVESVFNSEAITAVGLVLFGAPLIFVMAALRFRNLLAAADRPTSISQPPDGEPQRAGFKAYVTIAAAVAVLGFLGWAFTRGPEYTVTRVSFFESDRPLEADAGELQNFNAWCDAGATLQTSGPPPWACVAVVPFKTGTPLIKVMVSAEYERGTKGEVPVTCRLLDASNRVVATARTTGVLPNAKYPQLETAWWLMAFERPADGWPPGRHRATCETPDTSIVGWFDVET